MPSSRAQAQGPLVGRPGDGWWLWAPLPILALVALGLRGEAAHVGTSGLMVLNFLHLAATWTRLYGQARASHPVGAWALPVVLVGFSALVVAAGHGSWLLLLVFLANIPHIGLQNFGFIRAGSRARRLPTRPLDRTLDQWYQGLVPTWLAFWFATRPGADLFDSAALGLDRLPPALIWGTGALAGFVAVWTWARMAQLALRGQRVGPERLWLHLGWGPGAWACFALLPPELAAIPLAGAHYVQYLVIVRRFSVRAGSKWGRVNGVLWLVLVAMLAPGIPVLVHLLLAERVPQVDLVVGAAASLHHFLVDGRLWRLRDTAVAQTLLGRR